MSKDFYPLKVKQLRSETADAVTVLFEVPAALKETFRYTQGQYLTLRFEVRGRQERRAYSMCSSPLEPELAVTVKRVKKGLVSNHIHDQLKVGDLVSVMPPEGRFFTQLDADQRKTYYLIGAGSGITPLLSIIKTTLEEEPQSSLHLLYGNRNEETIIFQKELDELVQKYEGQLSVTHVLSRPKREKPKGIGGLFNKGKSNWEGLTGRIRKALLLEWLDSYPADAKSAEYFICGPGDMIDRVEQALSESGVPEENIHTERFISGRTNTNSQEGLDGAKLVAKLNGTTVETTVPQGKTVLDVLLKEGHNPPYSCLAGACSTCMAKVAVGSVKMDACFALDEEEIQQGYILTCQSHPTSATIEVDFNV